MKIDDVLSCCGRNKVCIGLSFWSRFIVRPPVRVIASVLTAFDIGATDSESKVRAEE